MRTATWRRQGTDSLVHTPTLHTYEHWTSIASFYNHNTFPYFFHFTSIILRSRAVPACMLRPFAHSFFLPRPDPALAIPECNLANGSACRAIYCSTADSLLTKLSRSPCRIVSSDPLINGFEIVLFVYHPATYVFWARGPCKPHSAVTSTLSEIEFVLVTLRDTFSVA